jgi:hypothetical protein
VPVDGGHLRASHADREHVIGALKTAFARGQLAKDEFDLRLDRTLASRTYADLAAVTADLTTRPSRTKPAQALTRAENAAAWGVCGLIVAAVLTIVVIPAGTTRDTVVVTAVVIYAAFWLLAGIMLLAARHGRPRPESATRLPSPRR